jgi:hypothetical protein
MRGPEGGSPDWRAACRHSANEFRRRT